VPLANALEFHLFMVNVSRALLVETLPTNPKDCILDLKAFCWARLTFEETIEMFS